MRRRIVLALIAAEAVIGIAYGVGGAGYVLDDWFTLGNAQLHGAFGAPGHAIWLSRPGSGLLYSFLFGTLGGHPRIALAIATTVGALTAVLLFEVCARYLPIGLAAAVAAFWVIVPDHTSLEFWLTCVPLGASMACVLGAALLLARPAPSTRAWCAALVLLAAGALTYEAVVPIGIAVALFTSRLAGGRISYKRWVSAAGVYAVVGAYLVVNRNKVKHVYTDFGRLRQVVPGYFGWGIIRPGPLATMLLAVALVAIGIGLFRLVRRQGGIGERLIAAGLVVIVLGALPFAVYLYAPFGAGDRFGVVSAIGGALVWVGIGVMTWRFDRNIVIGAAAVLAVLMLAARVSRMERWTTAAHDSARIAAAVVHQFPPDTNGPIVLGPSPVQEKNVAAFLDQSNVRGFLQYLFGRTVVGGIAYSRRDYLSVAPEDRIDIWALSELQPDVDLSIDHQGVPRTAG